jgi:ATP-dependent Clp protease protease subunit
VSTLDPNLASAPMLRGAGGMMNLGDSVYERLLRERIIFLGSQVDDVIAIYDTMQFIDCDVATYGMGLAASMGQFLLTAGTKGKRYALPHARIMMHQPSAGVGGTASDIAIQADLFRRTKSELNQLQSFHTGQPVEQIEKDSDRDRWFTAQEALDYGFVDHVVSRAAMTDRTNPVTDN